MVEREDSYVPSVMNVIPSDDGVPVVFHPDASEGIVGDLIVFIDALEGQRTQVHYTEHHKTSYSCSWNRYSWPQPMSKCLF